MQQCLSCGFEFYDNPKASVQVVLENDKGEILFLRRASDPHRGMLNTPGGFVEVGETLEEAACREVKEETGLRLKSESLHYIGSYIDQYLYKGTNYSILSSAFFARIGKSKIKISKESMEFLFYPKNKLPFKDVPIKSDVRGVKDYLKKFDKKGK